MPHMQDDTTQPLSLSWGTNFFYTSEDLLTSLLKYKRSLKQDQSTSIKLRTPLEAKSLMKLAVYSGCKYCSCLITPSKEKFQQTFLIAPTLRFLELVEIAFQGQSQRSLLLCQSWSFLLLAETISREESHLSLGTLALSKF